MRATATRSAGSSFSRAQVAAAIPAAAPAAAQVAITRVVPNATCETLISRPDRNRFRILRLYRQRYGTW